MTKIFQGKAEDGRDSWNMLPEEKKESIKSLYSDLVEKYLSQLKAYLETLTESVSKSGF